MFLLGYNKNTLFIDVIVSLHFFHLNVDDEIAVQNERTYNIRYFLITRSEKRMLHEHK